MLHHKNDYKYTKEDLDKKIKDEQKSLKSHGNLALRRASAESEMQANGM